MTTRRPKPPLADGVEVAFIRAESEGWAPLVGPAGDEGLLPVTGLMAQSLAAHAAEQMTRDDSARMEALIHLADFGIVLLDEAGAVRFVNECAQAMFEMGSALSLRRDRLLCNVAVVRQAFEFALESHCEAARKRDASGASVLRLPHPEGRRHTLLKIQQLTATGHTDGVPGIAVFLFEAPRRRNSQLHTLREIYGLSSAEAKVAHLLADGCDIPDIATRMNIAKNTVRAHLRSAYAKTGTKKQAQLVAQLCRDLLALESLLR